MKKLTNEELGTLITREMMSMMLDNSLSYEQRAKLFCAIVNDETMDDTMAMSFANSLKVGFIRINTNRIKSVEAARQRKKEYAKDRRASAKIDNDRCLSTDIDDDRRTFLGKAKQSKAKQSIDNTPIVPKGDGENVPEAISVEEIMGLPEQSANPNVELIAAEIERTYAYKSNGRKLRRCVERILKKNTADEILAGYRKHLAAWKEDDFQFAPGKITGWLYDTKFLEPVRQKKNGGAQDEQKVAPGCGDCGVEIV